MISSLSSVRRPRVLVSMSSAFHSGPSGLPMPKAGSRRPSDSTSMVAHCLASSTGSRSASDTTFMPKRMRRVRPGQGRHGRHAFEDRLAADQAVGLPQRIDAARLAQIDPAPVAGGAGEGEFHQAEADGDAHAAAASGASLSRWRRISSRPSGTASSALWMPAFS